MVIDHCSVAISKSVFDIRLTSLIDKIPYSSVTQNGVLVF